MPPALEGSERGALENVQMLGEKGHASDRVKFEELDTVYADIHLHAHDLWTAVWTVGESNVSILHAIVANNRRRY